MTALPASSVGSDSVRQRNSHAALLRNAPDFSKSPVASPSTRLDAIVVPASRGTSVLSSAIALSTQLDVLLVVLCSQQTRGDEVAGVLGRTLGARALIIDIPAGYSHPILPTNTMAPQFCKASGFRSNDLSLKRNIGLLLARLHAWRKILFLDDDISHCSTGPGASVDLGAIRQLAATLDRHQVAGMVCRNYPDNSVVCHARRLSGLVQDNFVSGAALGVNCSDIPLPFFPDVYNEDWFFFSHAAADRRLPQVGEAHQASYDPYQSKSRARQEEFGDLLAEGLYALFETQPGGEKFTDRLKGANRTYWERFIEARALSLHETTSRLANSLDLPTDDSERRVAAISCVKTAQDQLSRLAPKLCVDFLAAWQEDLTFWRGASQGINPRGGTRQALEFLELSDWWVAGARSQSWASHLSVG